MSEPVFLMTTDDPNIVSMGFKKECFSVDEAEKLCDKNDKILIGYEQLYNVCLDEIHSIVSFLIEGEPIDDYEIFCKHIDSINYLTTVIKTYCAWVKK